MKNTSSPNYTETELNQKLEPITQKALEQTEIWKKTQTGESLTQQESAYVIAYNRHFCRQHIEALGMKVNLAPDNPFELVRKRNPKQTEQYLKMFPHYIENFQELVETLMPHTQKIRETLQENRNVIILTNHLTFGNIPIIIATLAKVFEKEHAILDQVYTILGASLMTNQKEKDFILSLSNVLLTQPKTERGTIKDFEDNQNKSRKEFGKILINFLNSKAGEKPSTEKGKILIIAPSGTRDTLNGNQVILNNFEQSAGLIKSLSGKRSNHVLIPIGVNDAEVYAKREAQKGQVYLRTGDPIDLNQTEVNRSNFPAQFLEQLASLVVDKKGNSIGKW